MFIELLVVAAVLLYLNSVGLIDFSNPYAVAISVSLVLTLGAISFAVTHYFARAITDSLFGFGSWNPKPRKPEKRVEGSMESIPWLEEQLKKTPENTALSKTLCERYLKEGRTEEYIAEKQRIVRAAKLPAGEAAMIYNRIADLRLDAGMREAAIEALAEIQKQFPGTNEASNARVRANVIKNSIPGTSEPEARP